MIESFSYQANIPACGWTSMVVRSGAVLTTFTDSVNRGSQKRTSPPRLFDGEIEIVIYLVNLKS